MARPLKYKTAKELQDVVDEYFAFCDNRTKTIFHEKLGEIAIVNPAPYTMSGLAWRLGLDRSSLMNYAQRDEFFPTIKAAREKIHEDVENRLMETHNQSGAIFNLKNNFGWKDESKTDMNVSGNVTINMDELIGLTHASAQATGSNSPASES